MTPAQCRAARALLDLTVAQLARQAHQPSLIVFHFERGSRALERSSLAAIREALDRAGVEFIDDIGVKLMMKGGK
jgi:hypothetical protein